MFPTRTVEEREYVSNQDSGRTTAESQYISNQDSRITIHSNTCVQPGQQNHNMCLQPGRQNHNTSPTRTAESQYVSPARTAESQYVSPTRTADSRPYIDRHSLPFENHHGSRSVVTGHWYGYLIVASCTGKLAGYSLATCLGGLQ